MNSPKILLKRPPGGAGAFELAPHHLLDKLPDAGGVEVAPEEGFI